MLKYYKISWCTICKLLSASCLCGSTDSMPFLWYHSPFDWMLHVHIALALNSDR